MKKIVLIGSLFIAASLQTQTLSPMDAQEKARFEAVSHAVEKVPGAAMQFVAKTI